jgi:hypothetical protein
MTSASDPTARPASQLPAAEGALTPTGNQASDSARVTASTAAYVTRPTRWTIFLRTFVPWQLWRFARINLKMLGIIVRSRR